MDDQEALLGKTLGPFRVIDVLGAGGMGTVFRAQDTRLGRQVALKVLPARFRDDERRSRFLREARSAAAVSHRNIAAIYDVGEDDGVPYIAMELVAGETLAARLRKAPPSVGEALRIATDIAAGLAHAHDAGIVHRDLKPSNAMLSVDQSVKILDFGLATTTPEPSTPSDLTLTDSHTAEGGIRVVGTCGYMAPEQAMGRAVDARADVFSFGVILYEMLAQRRPFEGGNDMEVLAASLTVKPKPLSELRPDVPMSFAALVHRCLEREASDRPTSGAHLVELLRAIDVGQPTRRARRRSSLLLGAGVLAAALIAVVVMQVQERGPPSLRHAASSIQHEAPRRSFLHALTAYYAVDDDGAVRALDEVLQMAPDEPLAIVMRGRFRVGSHGGQEVDALLEHARRLVEGDQGPVPDLVRLLHRTPITDEGWDTLAFEMAAYAERYPSFYLGRMLLVAAVVYGRPRQAAEEAFALEQLDPAPARTYLVQAQGWLQSDRPDDAEAALRRGLERHPSAQRLWIELAEVLTAKNDLARAEEVLRGILDQRPENVPARVRLARVLLARGDDEGWRRENDKLMSGTVGLSSVADVAVTHATLLAARGRADEGNDLLARAIGYIERADDLHGLARMLFWQGLLAHRLEKDDVTTAVKRIEGILPKASMSEPARRNAVVGINTLRSLVGLSSRSIEEATAGVADLEKLAAQELFPKSAVRSHQMRLASRRGDVPEVARLLREHMEERRSREKDTLYSTMLSQWLLTTAHGLAGDERQHEAGLREILEQREPCENEHEPHEQLCRIFLVKASVTLAELHVAKGRLSEARALVDDVKALWPRADEGLPLMQRLREVEARLDAP